MIAVNQFSSLCFFCLFMLWTLFLLLLSPMRTRGLSFRPLEDAVYPGCPCSEERTIIYYDTLFATLLLLLLETNKGRESGTPVLYFPALLLRIRFLVPLCLNGDAP